MQTFTISKGYQISVKYNLSQGLDQQEQAARHNPGPNHSILGHNLAGSNALCYAESNEATCVLPCCRIMEAMGSPVLKEATCFAKGRDPMLPTPLSTSRGEMV